MNGKIIGQIGAGGPATCHYAIYMLMSGADGGGRLLLSRAREERMIRPGNEPQPEGLAGCCDPSESP